jgi:hypothetical protein
MLHLGIMSYDKTLVIPKSHDTKLTAPVAASMNELSVEERRRVHTNGIDYLNKGSAYIGATEVSHGVGC